MKKGKRLYINITNRCNTDCPFCCMYSGTKNMTDMDFDTFKKIIDDCDKEFELQLEGGEPLLNPYFYLFMEYAISTQRCKKIIILTNGIELDRHLRRITDLATYHQTQTEIKVSVNYWLIKQNPQHLEKISAYLFATEFLEYTSITCNVRLRNRVDEGIREMIGQDELLGRHSNIYYLQSYGKLADNEEYEKPVIVQNIESWELYSVDGTSFGNDLIRRNEYEKEFINEHAKNYSNQ